MKTHKTRVRVLAMLLVAILSLNMFPARVFAEEGSETSQMEPIEVLSEEPTAEEPIAEETATVEPEAGDVTATEVSDESLFSASDAAGERTVTAHQSLSTTTDGITLTPDTKNWTDGNTYVASGEVTIESRVKVTGTVTLTLSDGCSLSCTQGIEVPKGSKLTIEGSGTLTAGTYTGYPAYIGYASTVPDGAAAIGGTNANSGEIIINGGTVYANGGSYAAGIGGGSEGDSGAISINGGTVTVNGGHSSAGIGGGMHGDSGSVTISGGTVTVTGGAASYGDTSDTGEMSYNEGGAGIGGGLYGRGYNIVISGGTVTARGGYHGAGIGGGSFSAYGYYEHIGYSGTVKIAGGTVNTHGWTGIGGGCVGTGAVVSIYAGKVTASGDLYGIGTGGRDAFYGTEGELTLGLTNPDDYIDVDKYRTKVRIKDDCPLRPENEYVLITPDNLRDGKLVPYIELSFLQSAEDWNRFCQVVAEDSSMHCAYMKRDITLSADAGMLGTESHPFIGVFEGNGHTLSVNYSAGTAAAPFGVISGAKIIGLSIAGTISGGQHSAGLAAVVTGSGSVVESCRVSASVSGANGYCGGFIGHGGTYNTTLSNCVFTGSVSGTYAATLWGWSDSGAAPVIRNCLDLSASTAPIGLGIPSEPTVEKTYYTCIEKGTGAGRVWTNRGKLICPVTSAVEDVGIEVKDGESIIIENVVYVVAGEATILSLTPVENMYIADTAELTWEAESHTYSLTMPAAALSISTVPNIYRSGDYATCSFVDGKMIISGSGETWDYATLSSPWRDTGAHPGIQSVVIEEGITALGAYYFDRCSQLADVSLPSSLTTLKESVFGYCASLETIALPQNTTIFEGRGQFLTAGLKYLSLPLTESKQVPLSLCANCSALEQVFLADGITKILYSAFRNCRSMSVIYIPATVTEIELWAFDGCDSLTDVYFTGTEDQWSSITIDGDRNEALLNANIHYGLDSSALVDLLSGSGTASDPLQIGSAVDWNILAHFLNDGVDTDGLYFRMTNDISVSAMVGTAEHPFSGTFDGTGHSLSVNYIRSRDYTAPFCYASGAEICNLRTEGTIRVTGGQASGFVGGALGDLNITNCVSDVTITGGGSGHVGFVANCSGRTVSVTGSAFTGSIISSDATYCAGFLGWQGDTVENCVYAGTMTTGAASNDFIRTSDYAKNCYDMNTVGIERVKGKQAHSVTAAPGIDLGFGSGTYYDVSKIKAYECGLEYNGVFYAGSNEDVSLTLDHGEAPTGMTFSGYSASAGTLSGTENPYSLTMPDEDVILSAACKKLLTHSDITVADIPAQTYTGSALTPAITVKDGETTLTENTDYTVSIAGDHTSAGYYTVTLTGVGNYAGTATATFTIYGAKGDWKDNKLVATVTLPENANALLIAASYDSTGRQVGVKIIEIKADQAEYETGLTKKSGYTYKLMLVSKTTYAPLCAAWESKETT